MNIILLAALIAYFLMGFTLTKNSTWSGEPAITGKISLFFFWPLYIISFAIKYWQGEATFTYKGKRYRKGKTATEIDIINETFRYVRELETAIDDLHSEIGIAEWKLLTKETQATCGKVHEKLGHGIHEEHMR